MENNYIYFLHSDHGVKIGKSKDPESRASELMTQMPFKVNKKEIFSVNEMEEAEKYLHIHFESSRLNGEWFDIDEENLEEARFILNEKFNSRVYIKPKIKPKKIVVQICLTNQLAERFDRLLKTEYSHFNKKSLVIHMIHEQVTIEEDKRK